MPQETLLVDNWEESDTALYCGEFVCVLRVLQVATEAAGRGLPLHALGNRSIETDPAQQSTPHVAVGQRSDQSAGGIDDDLKDVRVGVEPGHGLADGNPRLTGDEPKVIDRDHLAPLRSWHMMSAMRARPRPSTAAWARALSGSRSNSVWSNA